MVEETTAESSSFILKLWRDYRMPLLFLCFSFVCIGVALYFIAVSLREQEPIEFISSTASSSGVLSAEIMVDVAGAVEQPGVYRLRQGSRVEDVLGMAGGFAQTADSLWVERSLNRSQVVRDGQKIYIPRKGELNTSHNETNGVSPDTTSHNIVIDQALSGSAISINSATQNELESLSGVGPVTAQKIIQGRPYLVLDELLTKKIVGKSLFEKIRSSISL